MRARRRRTRTRLGLRYREALRMLRPELLSDYDRTPRQLELFDGDDPGGGGRISTPAAPEAARPRACFFLPKGAAGAATQIVS